MSPRGEVGVATSKVCPSCGAVNDPSNVFCIHCGKPLAAGPAQATATYPTAYPPGYPAMPPGVPAPPGAYPYFGPPPRRATASSILSGMFDVWTKNFVNFFLVFSVVALVNGLLGALFFYAFLGTFAVPTGFVPPVPSAGGSVDVGRFIGLAIAVALVGAILNSIIMGGMTEYAVRHHRGEQIGVEAALRRGLQRFLSILGATILLILLVVAVLVVPFALLVSLAFSGAAAPGGGIGAVCGLIVAFFVGGFIALYVGIGMSLYAPAIMMENQGAIGGLSRSWHMTKGHRWSLFGALLVTVILSSIINGVITFPAGFLGNAIVNVVAGAIASGIVGGWIAILTAVAYDLIVSQPTPMYGPPPYVPGPGSPPMPGSPPGPQPPAPPIGP